MHKNEPLGEEPVTFGRSYRVASDRWTHEIRRSRPEIARLTEKLSCQRKNSNVNGARGSIASISGGSRAMPSACAMDDRLADDPRPSIFSTGTPAELRLVMRTGTNQSVPASWQDKTPIRWAAIRVVASHSGDLPNSWECDLAEGHEDSGLPATLQPGFHR